MLSRAGDRQTSSNCYMDPKEQQFVVFGEMGQATNWHAIHFTLLLLQLTDFVERLLKHARNGDLQLMRRPIEAKFGMLLTYR